MKKLLTVLVVAAAVSACSSSASQATDVVLDEFSVLVGAGEWPSGRLDLAVDNAGEFAHTLVITSSEGTVLATSAVLEPGEATTMTVELAPGVYHLTCRIVTETPDGEVVDHYEHGMHAAVEVVDA